MNIAAVLSAIANEKRVQQQSRGRELAYNEQIEDVLLDEGLEPPVEGGDPLLVLVGSSLFEIRRSGPCGLSVASVKNIPVIRTPSE